MSLNLLALFYLESCTEKINLTEPIINKTNKRTSSQAKLKV